MQFGTRPSTILLADDDPKDVELLRAAIGQSPLSFEVVGDGLSVLNYLYTHASPALVLLDLKLPLLDGVEVLQRIKSNATMRHIPVIVLTGSNLENDVARSYAAGANAYVVKPFGVDTTQRAMQSVIRFWLRQNVVPTWAQVVRLSH